jgi:hypothetical protein
VLTIHRVFHVYVPMNQLIRDMEDTCTHLDSLSKETVDANVRIRDRVFSASPRSFLPLSFVPVLWLRN